MKHPITGQEIPAVEVHPLEIEKEAAELEEAKAQLLEAEEADRPWLAFGPWSLYFCDPDHEFPNRPEPKDLDALHEAFEILRRLAGNSASKASARIEKGD